jgi:hypothetical protein
VSAGLTRRQWTQAMLLSVVPAMAVMAAQDASERLLPTSQSLPKDLAAALAGKQPLVVMATLRGCPFCKVVREHYLRPLSQSGAFVTQIHFLSDDALINFYGSRSTHGNVVKQLGIEVAPTVLFFGRDGRELAPRLSGSSIPDFYGAYLDDRMETARASLISR